MKIKSLLAVLGLSIQSIGQAAPTDVYYVNGVWNTDFDIADESREKLELAITSHPSFTKIEGPKKEKVSFKTNYNSSMTANGPIGYIEDVIAAINQSGNEVSVAFGQYMLGYIPLPSAVKSLVDEIIERYSDDVWVGDADVVDHSGKYEASLKQCKKVLIVPHSQGNLYANRGYELTFQNGIALDRFKGSIGISGIASPGVYVAGTKSNYTTYNFDLVINGIRAVNPFVLLPNFSFPENDRPILSWGDDSGHKVVETYLNPQLMLLRNAVLTSISDVGGRLSDAPGCQPSLLDLSPKKSSSEAFDDLNNDGNNKDPEEVEKGSPVYFEGVGLASAQWEIPGVPGRLTATKIQVPQAHPLTVAGSEVYKLTIPSDAPTSDSVIIKAYLGSGSTEQVFSSPRAVKIKSAPVAFRKSTVSIYKDGSEYWNTTVEFLSGVNEGKKKESLSLIGLGETSTQLQKVTLVSLPLEFGSVGPTIEIRRDLFADRSDYGGGIVPGAGFANPDITEERRGGGEYIEYRIKQDNLGQNVCSVWKKSFLYYVGRNHISALSTGNCSHVDDPAILKSCVDGINEWNIYNARYFGWSEWVDIRNEFSEIEEPIDCRVLEDEYAREANTLVN